MLKSIHIRNFRSLAEVKIDCRNINTFVGTNDAGKSNVLRALNLFFNNETDYKKEFIFENDFSQYHSTQAKKAREIVIELIFNLPENYCHKDDKSREILWKKVWRQNGYQEGKRCFNDPKKEVIPAKRKINDLLNGIRFYLIPAIKEQGYFCELFGEIYDVIREVSEESLKKSAKNFENEIGEQLQNLVDEIKGRAQFKLSEDLRVIFEDLELRINDVPLNRHGDGIKVQQIPLLLNFFATQRDKLRGKGKSPLHHIWGYEEPENSLEMDVASSVADQLEKYLAGDRRMLFMTTHSPIFYNFTFNKLEKKEAILYRLLKEEREASKLIQISNKQGKKILDRDMGLMGFVAPYLREIEKERDHLEEKLKHLSKPLILMEGETDVRYLKKAFALFNKEEHLEKIDIEEVGLKTSTGTQGGGCKNLDSFYNQIVANPSLSPKPIFLIYDCDVNQSKNSKSSDDKIIKKYYVPKQKEREIPGGIENLLNIQKWPEDCISYNEKKDENTGIKKDIPRGDKKKLCEKICKEGRREVFKDFQIIIKEIEDWFKSVSD